MEGNSIGATGWVSTWLISDTASLLIRPVAPKLAINLLTSATTNNSSASCGLCLLFYCRGGQSNVESSSHVWSSMFPIFLPYEWTEGFNRAKIVLPLLLWGITLKFSLWRSFEGSPFFSTKKWILGIREWERFGEAGKTKAECLKIYSAANSFIQVPLDNEETKWWTFKNKVVRNSQLI